MKNIEIGIVKWYGGYNYNKKKENDFGFIKGIDSIEEIFFHESSILCNPKDLKEGLIVTFETGVRNGKKKKEAIKVNVPNLDNEDVFQAFFKNNNRLIWGKALKKVLSKIDKVDENMATSLIEKYQQLYGQELKEYVSLLPKHVFYDFNDFRALLDTENRLKVCMELYSNPLNHESMIIEFQQIIKEEPLFRSINSNAILNLNYNSLWDLFSDEILLHKEIWPLVIETKKYAVLEQEIQSAKSEEGRKKFENLLIHTAINGNYPEFAPDKYKKTENIFKVLSDIEQVSVGWDNLEKYWLKMKRDAKIFASFRAIQEEENLFIADYYESEEDLLVKLALYLLGRRKGRRVEAKHVHELIEEYVTSRAKNSREKLNLGPLLADCPFKCVDYCEARSWKIDENTKEEIVYCPRTKKRCPIKKRNNQMGAHVYPIVALDWSQWTLAEALNSIGSNPRSDAIDKGFYLMKLAGWINRLNEIRERMQCLTCGKVHLSDMKYAFHPARYNNTVASCPDDHEKVYFNHCWNCHYIIDSRESTIKKSGRHLCIKCGSGPQGNDTSFIQGDICPKCGTACMEKESYFDDTMVCSSSICGHRISLKGKQTIPDFMSENTSLV